MAALPSRCGHYIFALWFLSFFFFSPNLSGRRLDVYHTSTHGVAFSANFECMSEICCTRLAEIHDAKKSPSRHHRTILSGHVFATKACIDNRKKNMLNINISSMRPRNMVNFGPITAENRWRVWGTPATFNGFRVSAALLHGTPAVGVSQTVWGWREGATYIRQGGHHVGHRPRF